MISLVQENFAELQKLCDARSVRRLILFGSAARSDFDPASSDLDFLVEFRSLPPGSHADAYFGLLTDLERLFGRPIDLLETHCIPNPYLRRAIEKSKVTVYDAA